MEKEKAPDLKRLRERQCEGIDPKPFSQRKAMNRNGSDIIQVIMQADGHDVFCACRGRPDSEITCLYRIRIYVPFTVIPTMSPAGRNEPNPPR